MNPIRPTLMLLAVTLLPAGCGGDAPAPPAGREPGPARPTAELPAPAAGDGSVTGTPTAPGPGNVPLGGEPPPDPLLPADGRFGLPPLEDNPEAGLAGDAAPPADAASPEEADRRAAAEVVRAYYAAIEAGDYPRAYALWSDGGRGSGQTPERFAAGFASTRSIELHLGEPGRVEGAAGSRYVEIPVAVTARHEDGSLRRYAGSYTLRRAVVDGAGAEQRAWRIASAALQEVRL